MITYYEFNVKYSMKKYYENAKTSTLLMHPLQTGIIKSEINNAHTRAKEHNII